MASLIVLRRFLSSLANILKSSTDTVWPEMVIWSWIGEGDFWCSLYLSPKVLADSPIYSSSHSTLLHLNLYITPLLFRIGFLSLGFIRRFLMVCPPFKCTSIPYFLQVLLKLSLGPWWYGTVMCDLCSWLLLMVLLFFFFLGGVVWLIEIPVMCLLSLQKKAMKWWIYSVFVDVYPHAYIFHVFFHQFLFLLGLLGFQCLFCIGVPLSWASFS